MKIGVVILPEYDWGEASERWRRAEELGFDSAWTYDHLSWRQLASKPWYATFPTLAAAASVTNRIQLGTMVTTPNFRHPVLTAKEAMTIDSISNGRFTLGIGSGSSETGDSELYPDGPLTSVEKVEKFGEFVSLVDQLLQERISSHSGKFYTVSDISMVPGCIRKPRIPFVIAAHGRRAMEIAAMYGEAWVTIGTADWSRSHSLDECVVTLRSQIGRLSSACDSHGRTVESMQKIFMPSPVSCANPVASVDSFLRTCESVSKVGITEILVHWPREAEPYFAPDILSRLAGKAFDLVRDM